MQFGVITLFPEMFAALQYGIPGQALKKKLVELHFWNPRDFTTDPHRTVDDRPYGGGPGMVMRVEPLQAAVRSAKQQLPGAKVIYLSPQGKLLDQQALQHFAKQDKIILLAGRYEGIDERLVEIEVDEEWSIGDYVLSGGELAAMVMMDGIIRLLPNALGHADSALQDSFMQGLLDCPHYTRPEVVDERRVPSVLTSGNHEAIKQWRLQQALGRTWQRRPDLLAKRGLSPLEEKLLAAFIAAKS